MENIHGTLVDVLLVWAIVTAILVALIVYRATIEIREDDQVFLGSMADARAQEQQEIVGRIEKLSLPIKLLTVLSVILFLVAAGTKFYEYFQSF